MDNITVYNKTYRMSEKRFDEYFAILEQAFPPSERRSRKGHLKEFEAPEFNSICYCPDGLVGFINYWDFDEFIYVEHFAVHSEHRGQGTGAALVARLRSRVAGKPMVLEAEPPQDSPTAARRIAFYERLGFVLNGHEYIQPPMSEGQPSVPLVIMSSPQALSEQEFIKIRDTMYCEVYNKEYFF